MFLWALLSTIFITSESEAKLVDVGLGLDAIYGVDNRELISDKSPYQIKKLAASVAMIVSSDTLDIGFFKTTIKALSLKDKLNMCANENFVSSPSVTDCTGFLVGPDILATAGHCFQNEEDCVNKKIIFDVDSRKQGPRGYSVYNQNVYSCKEIIRSEASAAHDYALIRLSRKTNRTPLKLNKSLSKLADESFVFMIGHPMGLPLILSKEAQVSDNSDASIFKTALDSFEGNSGSPVFNAKTFEVEGLLVNGQEDFVLDSNGGCYRNKSYDDAGGEGVTRISDLLPFIN